MQCVKFFGLNFLKKEEEATSARLIKLVNLINVGRRVDVDNTERAGFSKQFL